MALPRGWRRLSEREKAEVRRAYQAALAGGMGVAASRSLYYMLRGKTRAEVLEILTAAGREFAAEASKRLLAATGQARARAGKVAAESVARAAVGAAGASQGTLADRAAAWLRRRADSPLESYRVSPIVGRRSAVLHPTGDVWLSRNLHKGNSPAVIQRLRTALVEGARHTETASALAQRLRDEIGHIVNTGKGSTIIPAKVRQIEAEAYRAIRASGDPRASQRFASIRSDFRRYADDLRQTTKATSAAAQDLLTKIERAVAKGDAVAVESAVKWHAWNREQDHQQLIARTETARAFSNAYVEAGKQNPFVVAWEWNTDGEACDECQALSGQVMTEADLVLPPAHPNCECYLTEVTDTSVEVSDAEWDQILAGDAA